MHEGDNKGPDWVDRWSRNLATAVQKAWPPTRDFVKDWSRGCYIAVRRARRPTRDFAKWWWKIISETARSEVVEYREKRYLEKTDDPWPVWEKTQDAWTDRKKTGAFWPDREKAPDALKNQAEQNTTPPPPSVTE